LHKESPGREREVSLRKRGKHGDLRFPEINGDKPVIFMTEKLCPFDKEPCIGQRCAIFIEAHDCCALAMPVKQGSRISRDISDKKSDSSRFKAHLFD
jgi:hypothetical protein